jgi:hypothetical protein
MRFWTKALDWVADPRENLDHTYRRQVALLTKLQRDAAGADAERLGAARARLEVTVEFSRVRLQARETAGQAAEALSRLGDVWSWTGQAGTRGQLLTQLGSGISDLDACRERLDGLMGTLRRLQAEVGRQASQAIGAGREDLAREAAVRQAGIGGQLSDLAAQRDAWRAEVDRFTASYDGSGE